MAETVPDPWLTIIGIGEDGRDGLSLASRTALDQAEVVIGAPRHLHLVPGLTCPLIEWPVPFRQGVALLLEQRGRQVVMLASGDPFWFGAGAVVAQCLAAQEWTAHPGPSTFSLAAARLGWPLEDTMCLGLHAAPLARLRPYLAGQRRCLILVRDGAAVGDLARYLCALGFGASRLDVLEALGGPRERVRHATAAELGFDDVAHPVAVGITCAGDGPAMPDACAVADALFDHDGQMTKRPVRALTLSALAPVAGEMLWDIGAGSGSIGIAWLLADPANRALAFEADPARAARARANAMALGVDRLTVIEGRAPDVCAAHPAPDAVFIGGGLSQGLLDALWRQLRPGTRLVANAVTLESEGLLAHWHRAKGGDLLRIELAQAAPLGTRHGWRASYPVVQWRAQT